MLPTSSLLGEDGSASAKVDEMSARIYVSGFYRFCLKIPSRTSMADYLSNMQRIGQYVCRTKNGFMALGGFFLKREKGRTV